MYKHSGMFLHEYYACVLLYDRTCKAKALSHKILEKSRALGSGEKGT